MNKQYILTIHSFAGSSCEAVFPQQIYGPFDENNKDKYEKLLNKFWGKVGETMVQVIEIPNSLEEEKPLTEDGIKKDIEEYYQEDYEELVKAQNSSPYHLLDLDGEDNE